VEVVKVKRYQGKRGGRVECGGEVGGREDEGVKRKGVITLGEQEKN